jgi:thiol:disulfide interchange protein
LYPIFRIREEKANTSWGQALIFGLSIVMIFTAIGALLALILGVAGVSQFASNPWVNLIIGLMFVVFGISLLGMFELRLPYQLTNWLNQKSNEGSG